MGPQSSIEDGHLVLVPFIFIFVVCVYQLGSCYRALAYCAFLFRSQVTLCDTVSHVSSRSELLHKAILTILQFTSDGACDIQFTSFVWPSRPTVKTLALYRPTPILLNNFGARGNIFNELRKLRRPIMTIFPNRRPFPDVWFSSTHTQNAVSCRHCCCTIQRIPRTAVCCRVVCVCVCVLGSHRAVRFHRAACSAWRCWAGAAGD